MFFKIGGLIIGGILATAGTATAVSLYTVTPLPFVPAGLNDRGQVVGESYLYSGGSLTNLTTLPGANGSPLAARAINNAGTILGDGLTVATDRNQPFLSNGSQISDLGLTGRNFCFGGECPTVRSIDLNTRGQMVYSFNLSDYQAYTPSYVQNSSGDRREVFSGSLASAVNESGQVVGSSYSRGRSGPGRGLLDTNGSQAELTSTGYCSPFSCAGFSNPVMARDINDRGIIVGAGPADRAAGSPLRALIWTDPLNNPVGRDLGSLGASAEGIASIANSINNTGEIVGYAVSPTGEQRAVIWQNGVLVDLNDRIALGSGWRLSSAFKINSQGQIIGMGLVDGQPRGFLLTPEPIPEPGTILGAIAGIGLLIGRRKQRS
jgi:probable HAF family extracellular repeat protein